MCDYIYFDSVVNIHEKVQRGLVETGSEWDGWNLSDIFNDLLTRCESRETAADLTDAIMENRYHVARNGNGSIETWEAPVREEEPWAYEDEPSFFEDEVTV